MALINPIQITIITAERGFVINGRKDVTAMIKTQISKNNWAGKNVNLSQNP